MEDWELIKAGQCVQIIKKKNKGGVLKFGTEIITNDDKSLSALLGASTGASTSVSIMINILKECFPDEMKPKCWKDKITSMIPSYGKSLIDDGVFCKEIRNSATRILKL